MKFTLYKSGIIICYQNDITTIDISKGNEKLTLNIKCEKNTDSKETRIKCIAEPPDIRNADIIFSNPAAAIFPPFTLGGLEEDLVWAAFNIATFDKNGPQEGLIKVEYSILFSKWGMAAEVITRIKDIL